MLFGASLSFHHQTVTKASGYRLVDEFPFGYNQLVINSRSRNNLEKPENRGAGAAGPTPLFSGILFKFR